MTNIAEILKDCPKGTKLYCTLIGDCEFSRLDECGILISRSDICVRLTQNGKYLDSGELVLFPSKENRDWSTFKSAKKEPEFKPFDKVLVRDFDNSKWIPALHGFKVEIPSPIHIVTGGGKWKQCILYEGNERLLGTTENCE